MASMIQQISAVTSMNLRNVPSRWGASLKGGTLPELSNPEMNPTSTLRSVLFWVALAAVAALLVAAGMSVVGGREAP